jgi:hypothetical protein
MNAIWPREVAGVSASAGGTAGGRPGVVEWFPVLARFCDLSWEGNTEYRIQESEWGWVTKLAA